MIAFKNQILAIIHKHINKFLLIFFFLLFIYILIGFLISSVSQSNPSDSKEFIAYYPYYTSFHTSVDISNYKKLNGVVNYDISNKSLTLGNTKTNENSQARFYISDPMWVILPDTWKSIVRPYIIVGTSSFVSSGNNSKVTILFNNVKIFEDKLEHGEYNGIDGNNLEGECPEKIKPCAFFPFPQGLLNSRNSVTLDVPDRTKWDINAILIVKVWERETPGTVYWKNNIIYIYLIFLLQIAVLSIILLFIIKNILPYLDKKILYLFIGGLIIRLFLSFIVTGWDLQIYKGGLERFWMLGPILPLTLGPYGPIVDIIIWTSMIPYLVFINIFNIKSEFLLNFFMKIPFIWGDLLLFYATLKLADKFSISPKKKYWIALLVFLNPVTIYSANFQVDSLLIAFLMLSIIKILDDRLLESAIYLVLASSFKYWPFVLIPFLFIFIWKKYNFKKSINFVVFLFISIIIFFSPWLFTIIQFFSNQSIDLFVPLLNERIGFFAKPPSYTYPFTRWSIYNFLDISGILNIIPNILKNYLFVILGFPLIILCSMLFIIKIFKLRKDIDILNYITCISLLIPAISTTNVPQFLIWSLPFLMIQSKILNKIPFHLIISLTLFNLATDIFWNPPPLYLLRTSPNLDVVAYSLLGNYYDVNLYNPNFANILGFIYSLNMIILFFIVLKNSFLDNQKMKLINKITFSSRTLYNIMFLIASYGILLNFNILISKFNNFYMILVALLSILIIGYSYIIKYRGQIFWISTDVMIAMSLMSEFLVSNTNLLIIMIFIYILVKSIELTKLDDNLKIH